MLKQGTSRKILIIILGILILVLLGISIFVSLRLQTNQAPVDSSASVQCTKPTTEPFCQGGGNPYRCSYVAVSNASCRVCGADKSCFVLNCGQYDPSCGTPKNQCPKGEFYSGECNQDGCSGGRRRQFRCVVGNETQLGCQVDPSCSTAGGGDTPPQNPTKPNPQTSCVITYNGTQSFEVSEGCQGEIRKYTTSYNGGPSKCPFAENGQVLKIKQFGSPKESFDPNPAPGTCEQIDHEFSFLDPNTGETRISGGVCDCTPPVVEVQPPTATAASQCPAGSTTPTATLNWTYGGYPSQNVLLELATNRDFNNRWSKQVNAGTTTTNATGFTSNAGNLVLAGGTTYYFRVTLLSDNKTTTVVTFTTANCNVTTKPPAPTVTSTCPSGSTTPNFNVSWSRFNNVTENYFVDVSTDRNFPPDWFNKEIPNNLTQTTGPEGFLRNGTTPLTLQANTTYYVRIWYSVAGIHSEIASFTPATCVVVAPSQCIDLAENGSDPIASALGNFVEYTLTYQNPATSNPYPNMSLQVGPSGSLVGRDALIPTNALVRFYNYTFDPVTSRHIYRFRWEAISTSAGVIPAGTYDVRGLTDGTSNVITSPVDCLESITVSQSVVAQPLFNVVKAGAVVCEADGDARINYTITAQNISSVSGVVDFVEDNFDSNLTLLGIQPLNIVPSYGSISGNKIIWVGDLNERTYAAGQNKSFTYSVTIPRTNIFSFAANGVLNQVKLQYDTSLTQDNSTTFDLRTYLSCSSITIPNTGIFDDSRLLLIGMILIILGVLVYRTKWGYSFSTKVLDSIDGSVGESLRSSINSMRPFEDNILDKMEKKAEGRTKKSKRSK